MAELLPWQHTAWTRLMERRAAGRLPHALLLTGLAGLGKRRFAATLAASLLCQRSLENGLPCGACPSCGWCANGTHADLQSVTLEEDSRQIKVDQVRGLIEFLSLKSQYGGYRVGVIAPADRMNVSAANSLLKTLEEPPPGVVIVLAADQPSRLPITVRSRCQKLVFAPPSATEAQAWLNAQPDGAKAIDLLPMAGGAPLAALEMVAAGLQERRLEMRGTLEAVREGRATPVEAAEHWLTAGKSVAVPLLLNITMDLARLATLGEGTWAVGDAGRLRVLLKGLDLMLLYKYLDRLLEARRHLDHPLNEQLLLEDLFIGWQALTPREATAHR